METEVLVPNISSFIECNIIVELNTTDIAEEILENTNSPTSERDEPSEDSYTTSGGGSSTTYDKEKHSVVNKKRKGLHSTSLLQIIIIIYV